jgi:hypothetical protein
MIRQDKHTTGPWYVDRAHVRPTQDDLLAIFANNGDKLAILTDDQTIEWRANAQLIATAPELLVEAQQALDFLERHRDALTKSSYYKSNVVIARLRAAIKKASTAV